MEQMPSIRCPRQRNNLDLLPHRPQIAHQLSIVEIAARNGVEATVDDEADFQLSVDNRQQTADSKQWIACDCSLFTVHCLLIQNHPIARPSYLIFPNLNRHRRQVGCGDALGQLFAEDAGEMFDAGV